MHIRVAVIGAPGSGKTSLVARLHNRVFKRPSDRRSFLFIVTECGNSPFDMWKEFQFGLITVNLTESYSAVFEETTRRLARETSQFAPHRQLLCLLGTKLDLIPRDYSNFDLHVREFPTWCAHYERLQYFAVSSVDGTGINDVCHFIANQVHAPPRSPGFYSLGSCFGDVGSWILDAIASLFSLPVPENVNQQTPDYLDLDDSTVDSLVKSPEALAWDRALSVYANSPFVPTHKITPTLLAKHPSRSEYANMVYVREHTSIPVPQPRYPHLSSWLVMDLIDGKMLLECWETQSLFMKFRIACTLRGYISQLRRLTGTIPGTVVGGIVNGILFEDEDRGPFDSSTRFRHWCEMVAYSGWSSLVKHRRHHQPDWELPSPPVLGGEWPLVFTHGDLNLGNIMLSKDGVLWIIDWATSGFFPPWLESVAMRIYGDAPRSFRRFRWFITGSYPRYEQFWDFFIQEVHRYPPSRRRHI